MLRVELLPRLFFPHPARFEFLAGLPLEKDEKEELHEIKKLSTEIVASQQVAHLPYYLIIADRSLIRQLSVVLSAGGATKS